MAKIINITNGTGTGELINDTYTVTATVTGYDDTSIDPSTLNIVEGTNSYALSISATGTLTLHVTDDGTSTGNPIVGATFYRTDSIGTEYGSVMYHLMQLMHQQSTINKQLQMVIMNLLTLYKVIL